MHQDVLHKIIVQTKVFVVHSLSPAAKMGEDEDFWVYMSDDSGDMKDVVQAATLSFFTKANGSP